MKLIRKILIVCVASGALIGCNNDVDPGQKVDAPGYYNGPMKAKSTPADAGEAAGKTKMGTE